LASPTNASPASTKVRARSISWLLVWTCVAVTVLILSGPVTASCFRFERNYNEGWNVYNAMTVAHHQLLYPPGYGWTAVNYPMLSFYLLGHLHRLTNDYLFTARAVSFLSLIGCAVLAGAIVRTLKGSWQAAILAGSYFVLLCCVKTTSYIAMDDPQMLAQVFFLAGFLLFLRDRTNLLAIAASTLLFVIGGSIKQNPVEFPLAVLLELCLVSLPRAAWFCLCGLVFAAIAVALNLHYGGPYFLHQILAHRDYSAHRLAYMLRAFLDQFKIAAYLILYAAFAFRKHPQRRIIVFLLLFSLAVGSFFSGSDGVFLNVFFSAMLASAILLGFLWDDAAPLPWHWARLFRKSYTAVLLFLLSFAPWVASGHLNLVASLRRDRARQQQFDQAVAFLQTRPGPALCVSLLQCGFADKTYIYDPFNALRFMHAGILDPHVIATNLQHQAYGAVQLNEPVEKTPLSLFPPIITAAIKDNYHLAFSNGVGQIYVPNSPNK